MLLFAITAWNYCLISSEEQGHMRWVTAHFQQRPQPGRLRDAQRKTELYPRNRRLFMDLEVTEIAGRLHVNVVSTDLDRMG
jgi:hypothetical protein